MNSMNGADIEGRRIRIDYAASKLSGGSGGSSRRFSKNDSGADRFNSGDNRSSSSARGFDGNGSNDFQSSSHSASGWVTGSNAQPLKTETANDTSSGAGWGNEPSTNTGSSGWGNEPSASTGSSGWGETTDAQRQSSAPSGWSSGQQPSSNNTSGNFESSPMPRRSARGFDDNTAGSSKDESPTLYIGGLSFGCTEDVIREHFSRFGTILNIRLAMDRETGKPKG